MPTIYDIAKRVGVSASTVSRAFTDPERLNGRTKHRILEAADALQYTHGRNREKSNQKSLAMQGEANIHVGFRYFEAASGDQWHTNSFFGRVLAGSLRQASEEGVQVVLSTGPLRFAADGSSLDVLPRSMILAGPIAPDVVRYVVNGSDHCILVHERDEDGRCDSIIADNFNGALDATNHLLRLGHRKIDFVTRDPSRLSFGERMDGYFTAMRRAGCEQFATVIDEKAENYTVSLDAVIHRLSSEERPTGLVLATDDDVWVVQEACRRLDLSVPRDVSVVGFDDMPWSANIYPPLTTVRVDAELIGRIAMARLIGSIRGDASLLAGSPGVRILAPAKLIERQSCASIPCNIEIGTDSNAGRA